MGIRKLDKYLKHVDSTVNSNKSAINDIHFSELSGQTIAIDIYIYIYQALYSDYNNHIIGIINLIIKLKNYNITPIFVFDGKPTKLKDNTIKSRNKIKSHSEDKINILQKYLDKISEDDTCINNTVESNDTDNLDTMSIDSIFINDTSSSEQESLENSPLTSPYNSFSDLSQIRKDIEKKIKKLSKKCIKINQNHIDDLKELFNILHINYVHVENQEADTICSQLFKNNYVDGILSNDMDMIAYECNKVYRNLNFKTDIVTEYDTRLLFEKLNLTKEEFIDFIIIIGCDYCEKVYSFECKIIHDYILKYKNYENVMKKLLKKNISDNVNRKINNILENEKHLNARNIFKQNVKLKESDIENFNKKNIFLSKNYYKEINFNNSNFNDINNITKKNNLLDSNYNFRNFRFLENSELQEVETNLKKKFEYNNVDYNINSLFELCNKKKFELDSIYKNNRNNNFVNNKLNRFKIQNKTHNKTQNKNINSEKYHNNIIENSNFKYNMDSNMESNMDSNMDSNMESTIKNNTFYYDFSKRNKLDDNRTRFMEFINIKCKTVNKNFISIKLNQLGI